MNKKKIKSEVAESLRKLASDLKTKKIQTGIPSGREILKIAALQRVEILQKAIKNWV